ncbi:hypothetical protein [Nocardioides coralli]|uniref:hypothetical protein n=1 Tax=Nocardioides coralli TaxID=2872154 RepID=UPI001CA3BB01|nr:hypothetical protein [Nocardioides coralli]QZY27619.1 hypothetical protein K6T13_08775 [Nocardioides coralli]
MASAASLLTAVIVVIATLVLAPPAQTARKRVVGCTHAYWKHHRDAWQQIAPQHSFGAVFDGAGGRVARLTMLEALRARGGRGVEGAERTLARAAAAAWLNAAHDDVDYPWSHTGFGEGGRPGLVNAVNVAFTNGDRATMLALAGWLDHDSNRTECPLD